ncbi:MAG: DNA polymerase/3'-5' exonuclease PolX, partial [Planctomycetales bacterium]|nr:DNA polymerase/3'-5' exonuclease PolX [Planctomycetales bacterium]
QAAAEQGKALELNASPMRLDLSESHLILAARSGVPIAIDSDAHSIEGLDVIRYGVLQARRALLHKEQVLNTWPLEKLLRFVTRA